MNDAEFDALAKKVNTSIKTGNSVMDKFFKEQFSPDTGMWINSHPELDKIEELYNSLKKRKIL